MSRRLLCWSMVIGALGLMTGSAVVAHAADAAPAAAATAPTPAPDPSVREHDWQVLMNAAQSCTPVAGNKRDTTQMAAAEAADTAIRFLHLPSGSYYPEDLRFRGKQAVVQVSLLVDAGGNVRFAHAWRSFPPAPGDAFLSAAVDFAMHISMSPARKSDAPVARWAALPIKFVLYGAGSGPMGQLLRQDKWDEYVGRANKGDKQAAQLTAYVSVLVQGETGLDGRGEWSLLVQSALDGDSFSQMEMVRRFSTCGQAAVVDPWLFALARAGESEAMLIWATQLMQGSDATYYPKASELLHQVLHGSDEFLRLWVAGLLATAPVDAVRDPVAALVAAKALNKSPGPGHTRDPDYLEVLAAAEAATNDFTHAVTDEQAAIKYARDRKWQITQLEARLASYQAGMPWRGYLCDCDRLIPGKD